MRTLVGRAAASLMFSTVMLCLDGTTITLWPEME